MLQDPETELETEGQLYIYRILFQNMAALTGGTNSVYVLILVI